MKLQSYKEKFVYFTVLLSDGLDSFGSGRSWERGKSGYILAAEKNKLLPCGHHLAS